MIADRPPDEGGKVVELEVAKKERDKYICYANGCNLIPEIIGAYSDIGRIVLKCSNGHINELDVEEYLKIMDSKENIAPQNNDSGDIEQSELFDSRDIIMEKCKSLSNTIRAHKKVLNDQEKYPDNYSHNQNVINLAESIMEENNGYVLDPNNPNYNITYKIDDIIKEKIEDNKEEENGALIELKEKYFINTEKFHEEEELRLRLKGLNDEKKFRWLKDEGFELISKIRFKNLIEINLANNQITDLTPLDNMLLPYLEIINFSNNLIENIRPIANIVSNDLSEIYLQKNKIKDLAPFLNSNFPSLEIFRVDDNKDAIENQNFKIISKKYQNVIFSEVKKWDYFIHTYNSNLKRYGTTLKDEDYQKLEKLELGSNRCGDIIIKDLYPLINYPNKIKNLILDDNKLHDLSLLNRMPLYNLEFLDLSLNLITNIKFLKKFSERCRHLKTLYLNDNKINDISPLISYKDGKQIIFEELEALTLKCNCLELKDKTTKVIFEILFENRNLTMDYDKNDFQQNDDDEKEEDESDDNDEMIKQEQ